MDYNTNTCEKISISTKVFESFRPICESALTELAKSNINYIELLESPDQFNMTDINSMKHIFRSCKAAGVKICAYHSQHTDFNDLDTMQKKVKCLETCKRQIDTMMESDARIWGCHAELPDEGMDYCITGLLKYIEDTDACIVIENFPRTDVDVSDRLDYISKLGHMQLGLLLDIGHVQSFEGMSLMSIENYPYDLINKCGKYLFHTHLHGFVDGEDHYPPLYANDSIRWEEIYSALINSGYEGFYNYEIRSHHNCILEYVQKSKRQLLDVMKI